MTLKPGVKDFVWLAGGAAVLLLAALLFLRLHPSRRPAEQLAYKARRVDLVNRIDLALVSAAEAEKSSVLAITDADSKTYADQARAATAQAQQACTELTGLMQAGAPADQPRLLDQFSRDFAQVQTIDAEVLDLAVKNTNLKAFALAFGPAADAIQAMDAALGHFVAKSAAAPDARLMAVQALGAQAAALRIEALLAPHIAEESDAKMDALEARMAQQDQDVRRDLSGLAAMPTLAGDADLAAAASAYDQFTKLRTQILALSRENTNVRSLAISLNQKRQAMFRCQADLTALREAILAEPIAGVDYGRQTSPR
jgi:hypothetical protein